MKSKVRWLIVAALEIALLIVGAFSLWKSSEKQNTENKNLQIQEQSALKTMTGKIHTGKYDQLVFPFIGTAGSITTSEGGYTAALYDTNDVSYSSEEIQTIIDRDYSASYFNQCLINDDGSYSNEYVPCVMDHDFGVPAAFPAIHKSTFLVISNPDKTADQYVKVAEVSTDNRETADYKTASGRDVLSKSFVESIGDPSHMLVFITCQNDGRLVTFLKNS